MRLRRAHLISTLFCRQFLSVQIRCDLPILSERMVFTDNFDKFFQLLRVILCFRDYNRSLLEPKLSCNRIYYFCYQFIRIILLSY